MNQITEFNVKVKRVVKGYIYLYRKKIALSHFLADFILQKCAPFAEKVVPSAQNLQNFYKAVEI